jgi:hypothetical protein
MTGYLGAVAYIAINKFFILAQDNHHGQAWLWIVGGLALALAGQLAYTLLDRYVFDRWAGDGKKFILAFAALAAIVIIASGIWASGKTHVFEKVISPEYLENAFQRVYYIESAKEMIKERPLLGWGGGGWKEAYEAYMSYRYTTREAHSYYFQVGVETGIIGICAGHLAVLPGIGLPAVLGKKNERYVSAVGVVVRSGLSHDCRSCPN